MFMKQRAIQRIDVAVAAGAGCRHACAVMGISGRTLRRWRHAASLTDRRKGAPKDCPHALSETEKQAIVETCNQPAYQNLPPSQIVPRLADRGIYLASESSFYRVLRAHSQDLHRGRAKPPRKVAKPQAWQATGPDQVWTWDITYLPTVIRGQFHRLYMIMDVYSRLIVGWEVHDEELASHAGELMEKACLRHRVGKDQLVLHSDNGGPMKGATMLATLQKLGVVPSFSRPSVSNDNPYSEALFHTVKYTPDYPAGPFLDIQAARQWTARFVTWYNTEHRHSAIRFVTPLQRHRGEDAALLASRKCVYEAAKAEHPDRWRGRATRNWMPVGSVWLNPDHPSAPASESLPLAA